METIPNQPKTPETGRNYVEQKYGQLISKAKSIDETLKYLGGQKGLNELLGSGLSAEEIKEIRKIIQQKIIERKQYILSEGKKNNIIDEGWFLVNLADPSDYGRDGEPAIAYPIMALWGVMHAIPFAIPKGIQQITRKIQLGIEKRKLGKIEQGKI